MNMDCRHIDVTSNENGGRCNECGAHLVFSHSTGKWMPTVSLSLTSLTEHDRQTIREIQERCGVEPTGFIDSQTILAIHETLGIAHKLFSRIFSAAALTRRKVSQ